MSSEETGFSAMVGDAIAGAKGMVADARAREAEQLDLLGAPPAEALEEARVALGPMATGLSVVREARQRAGRPKGAQNRRTNDLRAYLLQFGPHPHVTLMKIQGMPVDDFIALSAALDSSKRRMTVHEALSLQLRAAEGLLAYVESKQPVAVDMSFAGLSDLIIEGAKRGPDDIANIIDAEFVALGDEGGGA